jgi:hypothetical protein
MEGDMDGEMDMDMEGMDGEVDGDMEMSDSQGFDVEAEMEAMRQEQE